jgi:hypothetical protein
MLLKNLNVTLEFNVEHTTPCAHKDNARDGVILKPNFICCFVTSQFRFFLSEPESCADSILSAVPMAASLTPYKGDYFFIIINIALRLVSWLIKCTLK